MNIYLLVILSGFAALSWEVVWQIKTCLALGISAWGTALTLAIMMGGMSFGSLVMGKLLRYSSTSPLRMYGYLELIIGICGLSLAFNFKLLEMLDTWIYGISPTGIPIVYLGIIAIIGLPTLCIGATLPIFNLIAHKQKIPLVKLYSINIIGGAISVLTVAFILIPLFGLNQTIHIIAAINILIGFVAIAFSQLIKEIPAQEQVTPAKTSYKEMTIVFITGFTFFTLEVAWFRSFSNIYANTTDMFAIILACVLIALGLSAIKIKTLKRNKKLLGSQLCMAGVLILVMTPIIEHLDYVSMFTKQLNIAIQQKTPINIQSIIHTNNLTLANIDTTSIDIFLYILQSLFRFFTIFMLIVPPMFFLGTAFPWILDNHQSSGSVSRLNAVNTFAAIIGSLAAAWILLPTIGFVKTAWLSGGLVILSGLALSPVIKRVGWIIVSLFALLFAVYFESGIGTTRVQGFFGTDEAGNPAKILGFHEGPQATISAVEYQDKSRALLINSAQAAAEAGLSNKPSAHYLAWMGHLPMLLHPHPKNALVICLGTGQTANAVREENPEQLDIVDVNPQVFKLAKYFQHNKNVLLDPRVKTTTMDGRVFMRRSKKYYDVITLEPMPPHTIGVNALYSREFYQLARGRLTENGIIAQWLPLHIVAPHYTASIVKTFIETFPNAVLWLDEKSKMGILLGSKNDTVKFSNEWPGFTRKNITRNLSANDIHKQLVLNRNELKHYGSFGKIISDDNQLLAYGNVLYGASLPLRENYVLLRHINNKIAPLQIGSNFK